MKYINEYNDYEKNLLYQGDNKIKIYIASLIKDLEVKKKYYDKRPHSTFFVHKKTGEVWMENDKEFGYMWVSRDYIWTRIESEFPSISQRKISSLIKYTTEIIFKISVEIPQCDWDNELSLITLI